MTQLMAEETIKMINNCTLQSLSSKPILSETQSPIASDIIQCRFHSKLGLDTQTSESSSGFQILGSQSQATMSSSPCLGDVDPTFEPLKVGLDSDDDSSTDESEDSSDDNLSFSHDEDNDDSTNLEYEDMAFEYFHKPRHSIISMNTSEISALSSSSCIPSLEASSDESSGSSSSTSNTSNMDPTTDCAASPPTSSKNGEGSVVRGGILNCSCLSNKKPRYKRNCRRNSLRRRKRTVSLNKSVTVIPIPLRTEYSNQVKERLWSSSEELYANAARNSVEFSSEGWNWRTVIEDEDMLIHTGSGELIHPIHLRNALASIQSSPEENVCTDTADSTVDVGCLGVDNADDTNAAFTNEVIAQLVPNTPDIRSSNKDVSNTDQPSIHV